MKILGDTHLGRAFKTGVPLHRIGDREAMVWADFRANLLATQDGIHVHMGDLFDKFIVAPEVILEAAAIYKQAAAESMHTLFVILRGNHDPSKDASKASAFDIFAELVAAVPNIRVITTPTLIDTFGFLPYNVFGTAEEYLADLLQQGTPEIVFGHYDVVDFGGANVIPTAALAAAGILEAFTGHDHVARIEKRHGVTINVVGSMQPYTHAEDPEGRLYRTVTLDELAGMDCSLLNIRVVLAEGETLPADLDCLSLTAKRAAAGEAETVDTTEFESIDLGVELAALLPESIRAEVMEVFGK